MESWTPFGKTRECQNQRSSPAFYFPETPQTFHGILWCNHFLSQNQFCQLVIEIILVAFGPACTPATHKLVDGERRSRLFFWPKGSREMKRAAHPQSRKLQDRRKTICHQKIPCEYPPEKRPCPNYPPTRHGERQFGPSCTFLPSWSKGISRKSRIVQK